MPTSWSGKVVTRSGAERRTCRLSYRRSSVNDCVGRAKGEFVVKSKYAAFAALDPFFDIDQQGLADLVDGDHYFDTIADDAEFEFRYHFPGWPETVRGRDALKALYAGYGNNIVLHGADKLVVHRSQDPRVVIIEYDVHGKIVATGSSYDNRFISVVTIEGRKIVQWRDYMDSLAAMTALSQVQKQVFGLPRAAKDEALQLSH